jgi:hypothetical protein
MNAWIYTYNYIPLHQLGGVGGGNSLLIRLIKLVYPVKCVAVLPGLCKVKVCFCQQSLGLSFNHSYAN